MVPDLSIGFGIGLGVILRRDGHMRTVLVSFVIGGGAFRADAVGVLRGRDNAGCDDGDDYGVTRRGSDGSGRG